MTVRDLVKALESQDPNAKVYLAGCDCVGLWNGAIDDRPDDDGSPSVVLERDA